MSGNIRTSEMHVNGFDLPWLGCLYGKIYFFELRTKEISFKPVHQRILSSASLNDTISLYRAL